LSRKIASAKRWGLVKGSGTLTITELGKRILHPLSEKELIEARKDSFLSINLFSKLYERFKKNLPAEKGFIAILVREYDLKKNDAKTVLNIYKDSLKRFPSYRHSRKRGRKNRK